MSTDTRRRLSRGSSETHVSHSHPIEGTPVEVPVPRKVSFIGREPLLGLGQERNVMTTDAIALFVLIYGPGPMIGTDSFLAKYLVR